MEPKPVLTVVVMETDMLQQCVDGEEARRVPDSPLVVGKRIAMQRSVKPDACQSGGKDSKIIPLMGLNACVPQHNQTLRPTAPTHNHTERQLSAPLCVHHAEVGGAVVLGVQPPGGDVEAATVVCKWQWRVVLDVSTAR